MLFAFFAHALLFLYEPGYLAHFKPITFEDFFCWKLGVKELKMLKILMGATKDKDKAQIWKGTAQVGCFSDKVRVERLIWFNPKKTGGPKRPPLDISCDYSATRKALAATLYDFFLSSFPHILTPNLWRPGVRFWSYVTFCTCTSDWKWLQNVILCTKSMQI